MHSMPETLFLLDSGDPAEYREVASQAAKFDQKLWGSTTNPSLIAKKLTGKKVNLQEAFTFQKEIVLEILSLVPGAVSAEVYSDNDTTAEQMVEQGRDIASWDKRVFVKLPTTIAGLKARTELRKLKIPTNNTLVFSQEQIFAICLHEKLCQKEFGPLQNTWPTFISPFVGRLDDIELDGMSLIKNGMEIKKTVGEDLWMLEASVRKLEHIAIGIQDETEIITAPKQLLLDWFALPEGEKSSLDLSSYRTELKQIPLWSIPENMRDIDSLDKFFSAIETGTLNIQHELTDKGIIRFVEDWNKIISG